MFTILRILQKEVFCPKNLEWTIHLFVIHTCINTVNPNLTVVPKTLTLKPSASLLSVHTKMAMYAMLRRASSSVLPQLARRATASSSSRTFQNVLSVLQREATITVVPSLRFANAFATKTGADDKLVQVLQSEVECALEDDHAQHEVICSFLLLFLKTILFLFLCFFLLGL